jgi:dephospho-CoA kinase
MGRHHHSQLSAICDGVANMGHFVVGLTGGIGSGKSAVSDRFGSRGIVIADADVAARQVAEPGSPALQKISAHFGEGILLSDGSLDRAQLRGIVFADAVERRWLESVTVPAIMVCLEHILANSTSPYSILMLSSGRGQHPLIDRHLVVDVAETTQLQRVAARDKNSAAQIQAIMATQPSRAERLAYAHDVITNEGDLRTLDDNVAVLHLKYLKLSGVADGRT